MSGPQVPNRSAVGSQDPAPDRWAARRRGVLLLLRFGVTGGIGFLADTAVVYSLRHALGLYAAGFVSYGLAATLTWSINRYWTFRHRPRGPALGQWALFMVANLGGLTLNRGAYILLIATVPTCRAYPVLAIAAGAIAGMGANFMASHRLIFAAKSS